MSRRAWAIMTILSEPTTRAAPAAATEPVTRSLLPSLAIASHCRTGRLCE